MIAVQNYGRPERQVGSGGVVPPRPQARTLNERTAPDAGRLLGE